MEDNGAGAHHLRDAGLSEGGDVPRCADGMEAAKPGRLPGSCGYRRLGISNLQAVEGTAIGRGDKFLLRHRAMERQGGGVGTAQARAKAGRRTNAVKPTNLDRGSR